MKREKVILIVDSKEIFDEIEPVINKELSTSQIIHVDSRAAAMSIIDSRIKFDIIFVDIQLAGVKFFDAIRKDKKNGCSPLIAMSKLDTDTVIATATRHGANAFLAKPFLTKGLLKRIKQIATMQDRRNKRRLCPDHPINIQLDTERVGKIDGTLLDLSLNCCHLRLDYSRREEVVIGDHAKIQLRVDSIQIEVTGQIVRAEQSQEKDDDSILILYKLDALHGVQAEKLESLLDEYRAIN